MHGDIFLHDPDGEIWGATQMELEEKQNAKDHMRLSLIAIEITRICISIQTDGVMWKGGS